MRTPCAGEGLVRVTTPGASSTIFWSTRWVRVTHVESLEPLEPLELLAMSQVGKLSPLYLSTL